MRTLLLSTFLLIFSFYHACAKISTAKIFGSNMVLQRNIDVPIWGWGDIGEKVAVSFAGQKIESKVSEKGEWHIKLRPMKAGGPFILTIECKDNTITYENILIGDVWVCAGQSNMQYKINQYPYEKSEVRHADNQNLRLFNVDLNISIKPKKDLKGGQWKEAIGENISDFSAVGYFFGKNLTQDIQVPVGLINISYGGTRVEPWTNLEGLRKYEDFLPLLNWLKNTTTTKESVNNRLKEIRLNWNKEYYAEGKGISEKWQTPGYDTTYWKDISVPSRWNETEDLKGFKGSVWYKHTFSVDKFLFDKNLTLVLAHISKFDKVWVNGQEVGESYSPRNWRMYKVPKECIKRGKNEIAIRIFSDTENGGFMSKPEFLILHGNDGNPSGYSVMINGIWKYRKGSNIKEGTPPLPSYGLHPNLYPALIYNAMVEPIVPTAIKGITWYQGGSNSSNAKEYQWLFPNMITSWRKAWGQGDFPFIFAQLANFSEAEDSPGESKNPRTEIREGQAKGLDLPNTGMAITMDLGEVDDIHPPNKQEVGRRLFLAAQKVAYQKDVLTSPLYKSVIFKDNKAIITFSEVGKGLKISKKHTYIGGFSMASEDQKFYWAQAKVISPNQVEVYCDNVRNPKSVRYAWESNPIDASLVNSDGLPLAPFRTDSWPLISEQVRFMDYFKNETFK